MILPPQKPITDLLPVRFLPNMLTLAAVCAGITAIRFAVEGNHVVAVQLIFLAALLDGIDGRVARFVGCDSEFGLELDSLADFLNFGVAPALIIYFWGLQDTGPLAWVAAPAFAICCILRLARFNVSARSADDAETPPAGHFSGVPAPAGAVLAIAPMLLSFAVAGQPVLPGAVIGVYLIFIGGLMVSRVPTPSFKGTRITREHRIAAVAMGIVGLAALVAFEWITLLAACGLYLASVFASLVIELRRARKNG
jgi:CDP-diacylglycerol--serine O-phosphatidyltransferase